MDKVKSSFKKKARADSDSGARKLTTTAPERSTVGQKIMSVFAVFKSRFSFPADVVLDEGSAKELDEKGYAEPKLQQLLTHRRSLLAFMSVFYTLALIDNIWALSTEFASYNDVRRCPNSSQSNVLTKNVTQLMDVVLTFGGTYWGKCEADHMSYRYEEDENGDDVKVNQTMCLGLERSIKYNHAIHSNVDK